MGKFFRTQLMIFTFPPSFIPASVPPQSALINQQDLPGQILGGLDGRLHPLHGEEGGQVGGVGGDHDQGEEPPEGSDHSGGKGSEIFLR